MKEGVYGEYQLVYFTPEILLGAKSGESFWQEKFIQVGSMLL